MHQPPQRNPRPASAGKKILKFGCLPAFVLLVALIALGSAADNDDSGDDKPPVYTVVQHDKDGNHRQVIVEVDSAKDLRAVFDAVTDDLTEEAGYYVWINCSTGGTKHVDNRLANGRYAVGRMGSVVTGMDEGDTEFSTNDDRTCPDTAPTPDASAREAAGLPPEPGLTARVAYLADLDAIDPDIVHGKGDKAVSRGLSQCSSFKIENVDRQKLINHTNYRFTSPNHPNGHGTKIAEQILDVVHKHLCPTY